MSAWIVCQKKKNPEVKESISEEIKTPFLTAIIVRDPLGENLIPIDEVAQIKIKAKRLDIGDSFLVGLGIDAAIFGFLIWQVGRSFSDR
jgi:hypothetical protein